MTCPRIARLRNGYPDVFVKALVPHYSRYVMDSEAKIGPNHFASLSILQWKIGDKEAAVVTANKSVAAAKMPQGRLSPAEKLSRVLQKL